MTTRGVRFGRQTKLAEIGDAGQARLESSTVELAAEGFARSIEKTYVERAGANVHVPVNVNVDGEQHAGVVRAQVDPSMLGLRHEAAREVGEGALRALAAIREVVAQVTR